MVHERVHVHCRVRPFTKRTSSAASSVNEEDHHRDQEVDAEAAASQEESVFHALADDGKKCKFRNPASKEKNKIKTFTFDTFFDMDATQEEVYEQAASSIVQGVLNGYNGTVFAYGQTGTGKTHTLMGMLRRVAADLGRVREFPSAAPHAFERDAPNDDDAEEAGSEEGDRGGARVRVTFFEIHGKKAYDLLRNRAEVHLRWGAGRTTRRHSRLGPCLRALRCVARRRSSFSRFGFPSRRTRREGFRRAGDGPCGRRRRRGGGARARRGRSRV